MLAEVDLTLSDTSGDENSDGYPWPFAIVPVLLNGHGPFSFGVEIGRGRTLLSEDVVRAIGVDPVMIPKKITLKGQECSLDFSLLKLRSLAIGAAELREFDAMVWALPKAMREPEQECPQDISAPIVSVRPSHQEETAAVGPVWKGILGFDFLKFFKVTFDFPEKKLRIESGR
jgi:hypothetical protein